MERRTRIDVLLVEDNGDHAALTMRALREGAAPAEIFWVKDGQEALDFLYRRGPYVDPDRAPRPDLILLDIHLSKLDGHDVLRRIKSDPTLRVIPVVILTTSTRADEIAAGYEAGANSYIAKPVEYSAFIRTIESIRLYWAMVNHRPAVDLRGPATVGPAPLT